MSVRQTLNQMLVEPHRPRQFTLGVKEHKSGGECCGVVRGL